MSSPPFEASAVVAHAPSPRLFGVPVPARAFGFAPGWQREAIVGRLPHDIADADLMDAGRVDLESWRSSALREMRKSTHTSREVAAA